MNDVNVIVRDGLANVIDFLPKLLLFIIILVVGLIVAKLIAKGLEKLLERVGFDRLVERGGVKKALDRSKFDASDIIAKIVYYTLVLFVLQFAFGVFGPNPVSDLLEGIIAFLPRVIVAIIIIIVAAAIAAGAKTLIQGMLGGLSYGKVIANIASIFILFLGITAALNQVEIATTVTTPVLITVLAIIGGVIIVGAGGGLIKPMQARWEGWLSKAEAEAPRIKEEASSSPSAKEQLRAKADEVRSGSSSSSTPPRSATGTTATRPTTTGAAEPTQKLPPVDPTTPTQRP
ncbi:MAG: hypothetical protein Q7T15_05655 [Microcella sp.]|uniref:mechanosensitive ion channel family protein n=1 Tax=Microcella sp. TaxID=1913979 RepID=UPI00272170F6|nr:hypothetical protein [Microcella sp.]MDO8337721.1 hypothetical protein [Microcella sp.]